MRYTAGVSEMPSVPGLVRRGNVYYYRRRVPSDIAASYPKREVIEALKTSDREEAVKRARLTSIVVADQSRKLSGHNQRGHEQIR